MNCKLFQKKVFIVHVLFSLAFFWNGKKPINQYDRFIFCWVFFANSFLSECNSWLWCWDKNVSGSRFRFKPVVPFIFMISVTFIKDSMGSHCFLGGRTKLWTDSYGFKSQPRLFLNFIVVILKVENGFLSTLNKNNNFCRTSTGAF